MSLSRKEKAATEAQEMLIEELALICTCTPLSDRPCAGLLAGGLCDDLQMECECDPDEQETEPEDL